MDNKKVSVREYGAITEKYIKEFTPISEVKKVRGRPCVRQLVLYDDKKYYLYHYDNDSRMNICEFLLMPKKIDFNNGIHDDILHVVVGRDSYHFNKITFNDNDTYTSTTYDLIYTYDYYLDQFDLNKHISKYSYDKDVFNETLKKYRYNELFYMRHLKSGSDLTKLQDNTLIKVSRDDYTTRRQVVDLSDLVSAFSRISDISDYEEIDDYESTMLDIADGVELDKEKINLKK